MTLLVSRMVLGTVQIGLPYGRLRFSQLMSVADAERILDRAWEIGVRAFDTAQAYGASVARLRAWLGRRGHDDAVITTKVKPGPGLETRATTALLEFRSVSDRTLLAHGDVTAADWDALRAAADRVGASTGVSVYKPAEVASCLAWPGIARIQAPGNIFDDGALAARGDAPAALDLRSIFLQGILLETPAAADSRARGAGPLAAAVADAAAELGADPGALLLAATAARLRDGDRLVLGVDDPAQLGVIERAAMVDANLILHFRAQVAPAAASVPEAVFDPRTWS